MCQVSIAIRLNAQFSCLFVQPKFDPTEVLPLENVRAGKCRSLKQIGWLLISLCALLNLTGCITTPNGFSQFYQDRAGAGTTNLLPYSGSTKVFTPSKTR